MKEKIGFIGCGHMASAMIGGMIHSGFRKPELIYASNRTMPKLIDIKDTYGINITQNNVMIAENCDIVFLSVTPNMYPTVIEEIKDHIDEETIVILIAAGQSIAENEARFQKKVKLVKALPNTPSLVGEGMTAVSGNDQLTDEDKEVVRDLFSSFGNVEVINEKVMDIASAVSGSSPAFVYMFIESLADSAVMYGMPREKAYTFAAQAVLGAAKMVLSTGIHPAQLKDEVCSPGGTTIQSVSVLERSGFRSSIVDAVIANMNKMQK